MRYSILATLMVLLSHAARCAEPTISWEQLARLPDPVGFAGPIAGTSHGVFLFAGGANFGGRDLFSGAPKLWHDEVFVLDRPDGRWRTLKVKLPRPLGYAATLQWHDRILVIGGENASGEQDAAFAMSWDGEQVRFDPLPRLPQSAGYLSGVVIGDTAYVLSGLATPSRPLNSLWSLDLSKSPNKRAWTVREPFSGPGLFLPQVGTDGTSLYLFGGAELRANGLGKTERVHHREAYRYTPQAADTGVWSRLPDMPSTLAGGPTPAPFVGGELYLFGGDDGGLVSRTLELGHHHPGWPNIIYAYRPETQSWRVAGRMPLDYGPDAIGNPQAATLPVATTVTSIWAGRVIVPGGEIRPGVRTSRVLAATIRP